MAILIGEEKKNKVETPAAQPAEATAVPTVKQAETTAPTTSVPQTAAQNTATYNNTMEALKTQEYSAPSFSSDYDEQISDLYDKIVNRQPFKYDYSTDPMYGQYRDQYVQQGKQAMRDTQGQAAALTGGYGSSYGQAVGQQQYDAYLQRLNDVLPELYGNAYDIWADEGAQLQTQLGLASNLRNTEYQQYRDDVADKQYQDAWNLQQADTLAQYGDFSKYGELFGDDTANKMRLTWAASNPVAAYAAGTVTPEEYYQLTGTYPIGYAVPGAVAAGDTVDYWQMLQNTQTAHGRDVLAVQQDLQSKGYDIVADGVWGPETAAAASAASGGTVTNLKDLY